MHHQIMNANLHFTISEKHNHKFDEEFKRIEEIVERKTNTTFNISFSYQKSIYRYYCSNTKKRPFRDENNGSLLFRPSGHGALIRKFK